LEGGGLKLVAAKVSRLQLGNTKLSGRARSRRKSRSQGETRWYWGRTATGACDDTQAETASRVLCECEDSAELKISLLR